MLELFRVPRVIPGILNYAAVIPGTFNYAGVIPGTSNYTGYPIYTEYLKLLWSYVGYL